MKKIHLILLTMLLTFSCTTETIEQDELIENSTSQIKDVQKNDDLSRSAGSIVYRYSNGRDHFYTDNPAEAGPRGYNRYEGILCRLGNSNGYLSSVTRWVNIRTGDRVMTANLENHPAITRSINNSYAPLPQNPLYLMPLPWRIIPGTQIYSATTTQQGEWRYEGELGVPSNGSPIYSYFKNSTKDHFYTNNFNELGNGANGYVYEGIAFYSLR